ncbi:MAG: hypothetical protein Q8N14_06980 [Candidatus Omnitrophota bacterium]|nr:hypothetical protein [Candidatus Omnitrophota bacterium]
MRKLNQREKNLAVVIVSLALISGLYFLAYEPITKRLEDLNQEIQEKELVLRRGLELSSKKDGLLAEYKNVQGYLTAKGSDEELVANFLKEIGAKARENSVSLIDLKPQPKAGKAPDYKKYLIDLSVEGNMEQVIGFIYGLETSGYVLRVERCSLSPKAEDSLVLKADILVSGIIISEK